MDEIPLFPLPVALFPGGRLPLQIFEPRYLDLVKRCTRDSTGFGIVLIVEGHQALRALDDPLPSIAHCGTYCKIVDFDQSPSGALSILVEGQAKFAIRDHYERSDRLMMAQVEFLAEESQAPVPDGQAHLAELLTTLMEHESVRCLGLECDLGQAREVGARLAELLPGPSHFKQRLLEMKDPLARLKEIEKLVERMR